MYAPQHTPAARHPPNYTHTHTTGSSSLRCKSHCFKTANIKILFPRSQLPHIYQSVACHKRKNQRLCLDIYCRHLGFSQEAPLSPRDHAMRLVSSNLANYHATVQKLLIRQVLIKPMVLSWRLSWRQCVINKPTTVELCISPVYRRLSVPKCSQSTM